MLKHFAIILALSLAAHCTAALAGDAAMDLKALRQEVLQQQAELRDLRAKAAQDLAVTPSGRSDAESVVSLRKNATVTIGGTVNTRYAYRRGTLDGELDRPFGGPYTPTGERKKREDFHMGDLAIADAKMEVKVDVNEHFDAYVKLDFHDGASKAHVSGIAENYWIRWKNICNTGFGLLVGRDALKFGDDQPIGVLDGWNKDNGNSNIDMTDTSNYENWDFTRGNGMFAYDSMMPAHTTYNWTRTTQLTPYWESADGTFRADVSFIQAIDRLDGMRQPDYDVGIPPVARTKYRSINYGIGSGTARLQWMPIDGLKFTGSFMNLYAKKPFHGGFWAPTAASSSDRFSMYDIESASSNRAVNAAVQYRPCFLPALNTWAQWTHGWNEAWVRDMDSDSINAGFSWDLNESLTVFLQGDWLRTKNRQSDLWNRADGWAFYTGVVYYLPYGLNIEAGWRHERINYHGRTLGKHTLFKGDTVYLHLGFDF